METLKDLISTVIIGAVIFILCVIGMPHMIDMVEYLTEHIEITVTDTGRYDKTWSGLLDHFEDVVDIGE